MSELTAAVHGALQRSPKEAEDELFTAILNRYSELHLRLLRFLKNPGEGKRIPQTGIMTVSQVIAGEFRNEIGEVTQAYSDLQNDRLVATDPKMIGSPEAAHAKRTTTIGDRMIKAIDENS